MFIALHSFTAPLLYRCSGVLGKEGKIIRCGSLLLPDVGVKGKLLEFKSLQVKLLPYLAKIATYYKQDTKIDLKHIYWSYSRTQKLQDGFL